MDWRIALDSWGFVLEDPPRPLRIPQSPGRACLSTYGVLPGGRLTASVNEEWRTGTHTPPPDLPHREGCYLHQASWHAQFRDFDLGDSGEDGLRIDVDFTKTDVLLRCHVHPLTRRNEIRIPVSSMWSDDRWLATAFAKLYLLESPGFQFTPQALADLESLRDPTV